MEIFKLILIFFFNAIATFHEIFGQYTRRGNRMESCKAECSYSSHPQVLAWPKWCTELGEYLNLPDNECMVKCMTEFEILHKGNCTDKEHADHMPKRLAWTSLRDGLNLVQFIDVIHNCGPDKCDIKDPARNLCIAGMGTMYLTECQVKCTGYKILHTSWCTSAEEKIERLKFLEMCRSKTGRCSSQAKIALKEAFDYF